MTLLLLEAVGCFVAVLFLLLYYSTVKLDYWRKLGVKGPRPLPLVGNFMNVYLRKESTNNCYTRAYHDYKDEPMVGIYEGLTPMLVLRDPDLIKDVLIKDFPKFAERTVTFAREVEPLSEDLFRVEAKRWRPLRSKFSPLFTSGKLKEMFNMMMRCSKNLAKSLDKMVAAGEPVECREIFAKFTTDSIGTAVFSIETNALTAEDSEFRQMGRRVFQNTFQLFLVDRLREIPFLFRIFGRFLVDYEVIDFFTRVTKEAVEYRTMHGEAGSHRNDFIDILADLKQHPEKVAVKEMDDFYMASQVFLFFLAGFKTSSLTITNAVYELALNQSVQEKARAEVKEILQKTNGEITYEAIKEMKYLNACFDETLRKYPVLMWISRVALTDYTFSGTKIHIPKGQNIFLPIHAIQNDPNIYPNPEVFDPERFTGDNPKSRHPMSYIPFGDGPRNCIGSRFARTQSKVALATVLSRYKIETCEKTVDYCIDTIPLFLLQPKHGVYVKMTKLDD